MYFLKIIRKAWKKRKHEKNEEKSHGKFWSCTCCCRKDSPQSPPR